MMRVLIVVLILTFVALPVRSFAEDSSFSRARVLEVVSEGENEFGSFQLIKVRLEDGSEAEVEAGDLFRESASRELRIGDKIVVRTDEMGSLVFVEKYRFDRIVFLAILFAVLGIVLAKKRGVYALIGLALTIYTITAFLLPAVAAGKSILLFGGLSLLFITTVSVVFAHGLKATTFLAVTGIILTMLIATGLAVAFTLFTFVYGVGDETVMHVQLAGMGFIDFRGLFLLTVLLGALGVLDDVTTAQASVVSELKQANPSLGTRELFRRASVVGQEHIISMINTLFLAYTGVSFPLLLLFYVDEIPVWAFLNAEMIAEEIVRTLIGSIALLLSVPLTTYLAAVWFSRRIPRDSHHSHSHSSRH